MMSIGSLYLVLDETTRVQAAMAQQASAPQSVREHCAERAQNISTSSMDEKIAGMNVRDKDIVQGDRLGAPHRNEGVGRVRRACLDIAGEPEIERSGGHDRRQRRQIDVVVNCREIRNRVATGRLVEDKLIHPAV